MAEELKDGTGTGNKAKVDKNNQVHVLAVTESEKRQASELGNDYNINTGIIALTGTATNSVLYFLNDEDTDFVIEGIAFGIGTRSATITDSAVITVIKNPTGGDIISDATAVSMKSNSNFGSSKALKETSLAYSGKTAGTITGGEDHAIFFSGDGRLFASVDVEMPRGSSIGITVDLNTSGGADVYCALIGYLKDSKNK